MYGSFYTISHPVSSIAIAIIIIIIIITTTTTTTTTTIIIIITIIITIITTTTTIIIIIITIIIIIIIIITTTTIIIIITIIIITIITIIITTTTKLMVMMMIYSFILLLFLNLNFIYFTMRSFFYFILSNIISALQSYVSYTGNSSYAFFNTCAKMANHSRLVRGWMHVLFKYYGIRCACQVRTPINIHLYLQYGDTIPDTIWDAPIMVVKHLEIDQEIIKK